jgi:hypothetical protein
MSNIYYGTSSNSNRFAYIHRINYGDQNRGRTSRNAESK